MIRTGCTCGAVRHALTDEHREVLQRAQDAALRLEQRDLAEHYGYRLEPCTTAGRVDLRKHQAVNA